jgi:hypothetical protein
MMTTVCGFTMDFNTLQHDQIYASPWLLHQMRICSCSYCSHQH